KTRQEVHVRGKIVVLAASTCETARILLNSRDNQHPDGVGNSNGQVGKYLMDTVGADGSGGFFPLLTKRPPHNEDGVGGMHLYMPWWNYQQQLRHELPFSRGFHIEFGGGIGMPGVGEFEGTERQLGGGYGVELKRGARKIYGAYIGFSCRGEMIPNKNSYCEIDKNTLDEWGIPVLRFHFKFSDEEIQMAKYAREVFREIIVSAGGEPLHVFGPENNWDISRGGAIIHEVGTCRMGSDPKASVVNSTGQVWDCKNVFLTDGAPFVSNADKNPTLSIIALGWRTTDYAVDQVKKLNV
ncbi:MAG: GMC oxidoreductase, partial [Terriglobia bacterium]